MSTSQMSYAESVEIKRVLQSVLRLLESPDRWTRAAAARTSNGSVVGPMDIRAVRWCLSGAVRRCLPKGHLYQIFACLRTQLPSSHHKLIDFNDALGTTHEDVVALLKRAIAGCE